VRRRFICVAAAGICLAAAAPASAAAPPWKAAADLRTSLAQAQRSLAAGDRAGAERLVARARASSLGRLAPVRPRLDEAARAARAGKPVSFEVARAGAWTALLGVAADRTLAAVERGDVRAARGWLLVREFRTPTRFSRPGADATLALRQLEKRRLSRAAAASAARTDLLDTYQSRLQATLESVAESGSRGFVVGRAGAAARAGGYFSILAASYERQRGAAEAAATRGDFARLIGASEVDDDASVTATLGAIQERLHGFRAAPLSKEETIRRAGQLQRFLALVPIEYDRGVEHGRVTLDFEIQEAVTFRDGAAQAFGELESALARRDVPATRRLEALLGELGADLSAAASHREVADPDSVGAKTDEALALIDDLYPEEWGDAAGTADFDVISGTLDRLEGAVRADQYARAEQARLEAYAVFEFGPEQRLRGLASGLFVEVEGLFWYGADGHPGLAQLVKRKSGADEIAKTREALDEALAEAETAIGSGASSNWAVVSNTAVIVFREGLEAVLILAVLLAGMVGGQRGLRRPLLLGAGVALAASAVTWVVVQTVVESFARYGEKLEAVVSLIAIAVLLLVLNWFYHRVYWTEHLASLHGRKRRAIGVGGVATTVGLVTLGFASVYREGFETVLFVQTLVLEAGLLPVLGGVALGLAGTAAVGVLTIALQRKLPHKRMLMASGLLIVWVLVVMVGTTVQTLQVAGWVPVTPVEGLQLPYWAGLWFGVYPTWEGLTAQAAAATFVLGSYFAAEALRKRKKRLVLARATG
jgi:high-affinity iron transporter